ncbi:MAG TPA: chemotaxis protein CheB, partial [Luteitalea sp.]|nr:chemotaxis protein CheB [Luteitalea sp.]
MDETLATPPRGANPSLLPIVAIGASSGGADALRGFFEKTRPDLGVAYVVMLHLVADPEAGLTNSLDDLTTLPVHRVAGATSLAPDQVYLVPSSLAMELDGDSLVPVSAPGIEHRRAPVDVLFRNVADSRGSRAVGIVLSGAGPHGSSGVKRVKEYGGLVLAQDPSEATNAEMPRHAIGTGLVDAVLPVREMPGQVASYQQRLDTQNGMSPALPEQSDLLREVLTLLRIRTGQDFSNYKRATVLRRLERRMSMRGVSTLGAYVRLMREQTQEATALMKD